MKRLHSLRNLPRFIPIGFINYTGYLYMYISVDYVIQNGIDDSVFTQEHYYIIHCWTEGIFVEMATS